MLEGYNKRIQKFIGHTSSQSPDNPRSSNTGVHYGNNITKLTLERGVKICATLYSSKTIAVCQFCEYANITAVFELDTWYKIGYKWV